MHIEGLKTNIHKTAYESCPVFTPDILIFPTANEVDQYAASIVVEQIYRKPNSVLTLPTGSTPQEMYKLLVHAHHTQNLDMNNIIIFNLDEYWPIRTNHPSSYAQYMRERFISHINISPANWHIPDGASADPHEESVRYEDQMRQSEQIDLAVLGIGPGTTCHIGFNERGSDCNSRVRYVSLDEETKIANSASFEKPEEMPHGAITQGVANILEAEKIILIAKGEGKAWGIQRTLKEPVGPEAPASFLRLHQKVIFILDQNAGKLL